MGRWCDEFLRKSVTFASSSSRMRSGTRRASVNDEAWGVPPGGQLELTAGWDPN